MVVACTLLADVRARLPSHSGVSCVTTTVQAKYTQRLYTCTDTSFLSTLSTCILLQIFMFSTNKQPVKSKKEVELT